MDLFNSWLVNTYIAHRGLHDENTPENSMASFKKAIEKGHAIELDVQLTMDNDIVVFHDSKISRMTGKDKYVQNLTKEDLETITLLNSEEKIPLFSDVLKLVDGKVPLLIEIKNFNKVGELEGKLIEMLKDYKGEFAIQSFNPFVLTYFKQNAPEILRGMLSSYFKGTKLSFIKKVFLKKLKFVKKCDANFISYNKDNLPNRFVNKYKELPVLAWTVRNQEEYLKVVKFSDNIIFEGFEPKI